jgi:CelD/BcsL family acetyltransferase involved in cellulose biosynthesis
LALDDEVIAVQAWFELGGRASFYQSGRDVEDPRWRGAGTVLHLRVAERACRLGFTELDMLRGAEAYKSEWADETRRVLRVKAAHGLTGRAVWAAQVARGLPSRVGR